VLFFLLLLLLLRADPRRARQGQQDSESVARTVRHTADLLARRLLHNVRMAVNIEEYMARLTQAARAMYQLCTYARRLHAAGHQAAAATADGGADDVDAWKLNSCAVLSVMVCQRYLRDEHIDMPALNGIDCDLAQLATLVRSAAADQRLPNGARKYAPVTDAREVLHILFDGCAECVAAVGGADDHAAAAAAADAGAVDACAQRMAERSLELDSRAALVRMGDSLLAAAAPPPPPLLPSAFRADDIAPAQLCLPAPGRTTSAPPSPDRGGGGDDEDECPRRSSRSRSERLCSWCNEPGHYKVTCPMLFTPEQIRIKKKSIQERGGVSAKEIKPAYGHLPRPAAEKPSVRRRRRRPSRRKAPPPPPPPPPPPAEEEDGDADSLAGIEFIDAELDAAMAEDGLLVVHPQQQQQQQQ